MGADNTHISFFCFFLGSSQEVISKKGNDSFIWSFFFLFCLCSSNTWAKSPEIGAHDPGVAGFTNPLGVKLVPRGGPRAKQLRRELPGRQQQQPVFFSHSLPNAENPQLRGTEWDLQVPDLPSHKTEQRRPGPARDRPAGGLHPHPAPKARSRRSRIEVWERRKLDRRKRRRSVWRTSVARTRKLHWGLLRGQNWRLRQPRIQRGLQLRGLELELCVLWHGRRRNCENK